MHATQSDLYWTSRHKLQQRNITNFTYFISDQSQIENLTGSDNQLYEKWDLSSYTESIPKVIIEDISAVTNRETCNANEYQIYRESISYIETVPSLADDHGLRQGALGCTEKGLTTLQRIGRLSTYKYFHIFLRRGNIQNCRPESKYDRKLMSVPSTELASIPRYAQKINVSLDQNHTSGAKT